MQKRLFFLSIFTLNLVSITTVYSQSSEINEIDSVEKTENIRIKDSIKPLDSLHIDSNLVDSTNFSLEGDSTLDSTVNYMDSLSLDSLRRSKAKRIKDSIEDNTIYISKIVEWATPISFFSPFHDSTIVVRYIYNYFINRSYSSEQSALSYEQMLEKDFETFSNSFINKNWELTIGYSLNENLAFLYYVRYMQRIGNYYDPLGKNEDGKLDTDEVFNEDFADMGVSVFLRNKIPYFGQLNTEVETLIPYGDHREADEINHIGGLLPVYFQSGSGSWGLVPKVTLSQRWSHHIQTQLYSQYSFYLNTNNDGYKNPNLFIFKSVVEFVSDTWFSTQLGYIYQKQSKGTNFSKRVALTSIDVIPLFNPNSYEYTLNQFFVGINFSLYKKGSFQGLKFGLEYKIPISYDINFLYPTPMHEWYMGLSLPYAF